MKSRELGESRSSLPESGCHQYETAYCCTPDRKVISEFEGPDKNTVRKALKEISIPFTAVLEATKA